MIIKKDFFVRIDPENSLIQHNEMVTLLEHRQREH